MAEENREDSKIGIRNLYEEECRSVECSKVRSENVRRMFGECYGYIASRF